MTEAVVNDFFSANQDQLDNAPTLGKVVFDDWAIVDSVIEKFEVKQTGVVLSCKVLNGRYKGREYDTFIGVDSKYKSQFLLCYWSRDELLTGAHKEPGATSVIVGSNLRMKACPVYSTESNGKHYQNQSFIDFERLAL